jgi:2-amino-4-hydroxy-6-hydroxymethyldihydropteridine diphosphokinase
VPVPEQQGAAASPAAEPVEVFIGLGANLGDAKANLLFGLEGLAGLPGYQPLAVSSPYLTAPVGPVDQPPFWNAVARGGWRGGAEELLSGLLAIEKACGRQRFQRWGPRTLDMDLLLFGRRTIAGPELTVPHPEMHRRVFVLAPLAELAPELKLPGIGATAAELLAGLPAAERRAQEASRGRW